MGGGAVAPRLGDAASPVIGAAEGHRRRAHALHRLEVGVGQGRVVQLVQRQPAKEGLGLQIVRAAVQPVAGHHVIGAAAVLHLQGGVEQPTARRPGGGGGVLSGRRAEAADGLDRLHLLAVAQQVLGVLPHEAGLRLHGGRERGDHGLTAIGAQRDARLGGGLVVGVDQGD